MGSIGQFLKKLRGEMTFREAAERSGLSHSYIRYLEMGKRPGSNTPINPTPDTLKSLSKAYNYSYDDLMIKAGYMKEKDEPADPVDQFIEYLELELTDEEIFERMSFKVDDMTLTLEDVKEFIAFVRAKRFMKSGQHPSRSEGP